MDWRSLLLFLVFGQLLLLGLDIWERFFSARRRYARGALRSRTIFFIVAVTLAYGSLQVLGMQLVPGINELIAAAALSSPEAVPTISATPHPAVYVVLVVVAFYVLGLCDYLVHRFLSHGRYLWFTHESHHLVNDVSTFMPGIFVRPYAFVVYLPSAFAAILIMQALLATLGYGAYDMTSIIIAVILLQTSVLGASHSSYLRRCGWMHAILRPLGITSPQDHWLHHCSDLDCNYGNSVVLWDRVFGTYVDPLRTDTANRKAGLSYRQDFLGAVTASNLCLPAQVRRRYQIHLFCNETPEKTVARQLNGRIEGAPASRP
ncbi:MAG: sterol desaturase family protein [Gammaproteobacteria bacterium]|nr:sterol desaturase family protein [Gammaproteobacteria bacterium]